MANDYFSKENLSTLFVWIYMIIGPYVAAYITQEQFTTLGVIIIGVVGAIYSSRHKNTMFQKPSITTDETVLNDEYTSDDDGC